MIKHVGKNSQAGGRFPCGLCVKLKIVGVSGIEIFLVILFEFNYRLALHPNNNCSEAVSCPTIHKNVAPAAVHISTRRFGQHQ